MCDFVVVVVVVVMNRYVNVRFFNFYLQCGCGVVSGGRTPSPYHILFYYFFTVSGR